MKPCKSYAPISLVSALLMFISIGVFISCRKNDNLAQKYTLTVTAAYPAGYDPLLYNTVNSNPFYGIKVKVSYTGSARVDSASLDATGKATFSLPAGLYNVTVNGETAEFAFNGISNNVVFSENQNLNISLNATTLSGGLVLKEIYYTGSKTSAGGSYYSDQFQEIYNNSDDTIYLDNLCIGWLTPLTSASESIWKDANGNLLSKLAFPYVAYIPGTGKEHPLAPRKSIIIAQDGIDHKTDPLGNSLSPVNLGNADWEYYLGDINGGKDADAVAVPNLATMFTNSTTMFDALYSVFGPVVAIFKLPEGTTPASFAGNDANYSTQPGSSSTTKYLMVPKEYAIDVVECVQAESNKQYKRVPADLDAGKVFCSGTYVSKSVRRKVKQIIDGKVIYKDTNNSTEDFLGEQTPTPGVNPTRVD